MALERARMIKNLFKNTTDCCWHNSVTVGTWGGLTGMRRGGSFLCGDDLQSGSSTGPPFNQRYLNCIVWPLWRALLRDIARPLRLQHFEDIIDGSFPLDVWDSQGNYKHQRLIIRLFFHTNNSPSVMNRVVVTAKQTSALITDWWTLQLWYFPCISLSSPIHVQVEGAAVSVGWPSPFFTSSSFPGRISRHSRARWERLPPNWTQNTGRHKSDLSNSQMSELVTWSLRLNQPTTVQCSSHPAQLSCTQSVSPGCPATIWSIQLVPSSPRAGPEVCVYAVGTGTELGLK